MEVVTEEVAEDKGQEDTEGIAQSSEQLTQHLRHRKLVRLRVS